MIPATNSVSSVIIGYGLLRRGMYQHTSGFRVRLWTGLYSYPLFSPTLSVHEHLLSFALPVLRVVVVL